MLVIDEWVWSIGGMVPAKENWSTWIETCLSAILSAAHPLWTGLGLWSEWPGTNCKCSCCVPHVVLCLQSGRLRLPAEVTTEAADSRTPAALVASETEEEDEVPTRGFLKRQAQIIVDAKSRHKQFPMAARGRKTLTLKWTVCSQSQYWMPQYWIALILRWLTSTEQQRMQTEILASACRGWRKPLQMSG